MITAIRLILLLAAMLPILYFAWQFLGVPF